MRAEKIICLRSHHHGNGRLIAGAVVFGDEGGDFIQIGFVVHSVKFNAKAPCSFVRGYTFAMASALVRTNHCSFRNHKKRSYKCTAIVSKSSAVWFR